MEWLEEVASGGVPLTEGLVREVHRLVLKSTFPDEAGRYRWGGVRIAGSQHVPPAAGDVPSLVQEVVEDYAKMRGEHPVLRAVWLHWRLAWIHPFADGNGRMARLLMNFSLMRDGYPPAVIRKEDRLRYLDALKAASVGGNLEPFAELVAERVHESLLLYLEAAGVRRPG